MSAAEAVREQVLGEAADERIGPIQNRVPQARRDHRASCHRTAVPDGSIGDAAVDRAPQADGVEILERQADRIHHLVARGARRVLPMLRQPLAHRQRLLVLDILRERRHIRPAAAAARRRAALPSRTCRAAPATCDSASDVSVRMLAWPSKPNRFGIRERDPAEIRALHVRNAVVLREHFVDERVVGRRAAR